MSALALKGQKHRWYCICAICIWLNSLITMVDSWVNNVQAERTQIVQNTSLPPYESYHMYIKICLIAAYFVHYTRKLKNQIKQLGTLKMSSQLLSNRPHQVLFSTDEGSWYAWPSLLVPLILQVNYNVCLFCFFCAAFFFILRFTWKQVITFNNKLKWLLH